MNLEHCRQEIDAIDKELVQLFVKRMNVAKDVAAYKKETGMNVYDAERERKLLEKVEENAGEEYGDYARRLYSSILDLSRTYQSKSLAPRSGLSEAIEKAMKDTPQLFPEKAIVACQGVEGAHSSAACQKLFEKPSIMYCNSFEAVFQAVESGLCSYGVVPLENSSAGSVTQIYNLMSEHKFSIVRSTKMQIEHSLLSKRGVKKDDIKEIFSHPQAISQCSEFLQSLGKDVKITECANTALAAKLVSESPRSDVAALSSETCAPQYGLQVIKPCVQNTKNNYTRFICFSKKLEIYPGADRTSLLLRTPHRAGALYSVIANFYSLGINIIKLESRPIPESDFEFMFYFDIDVSVYSDKLPTIIDQLEYSLGTQNIKYLGSYREA
ncbi:MAG: chorismate mutase [Ruminococcaceae bacterium]|nr:chorismate mutase [Oscillospiraceae bacterium]